MATTVLVIDDDQSMCELLQAALTPRGYELTWCLHAEGALDVLRERDVDVVLADLNLEGESTGMELLRK